MRFNFKFEGHYDNEENKWKYSYETNAEKITIRDIHSDYDNIYVDVDLETKYSDNTKENNYINELSLISSSNYNEESVKDVFKKIHLESIDYSNADKNGNITLYKFNKSVLPVYIRSGHSIEGKSDTYSYEEVEALKKKYNEFDDEPRITDSFPDNIFTEMFITSVELVKNTVFKDHDVYYLYVSNKTMYEEITGRDLPEYGAFWELKHTRVTNYLTKERIGKCIYCLQNEKENC